MGSWFVDNLPGISPKPGWQLIKDYKCDAVRKGAALVYDTITDITVSSLGHLPFFVIHTEDGETWAAFTLILATGGTPKTLHVLGEERYLQVADHEKQIFTCSNCDARIAEGKQHVYVVGGGDAAVDAVKDVLTYAARCTLLVRKNAMRASPSVQARIAHDSRVTILYETEIVEMCGDGSRIYSIRLKTPNGLIERPVDVLYLAIGRTPGTDCPWMRALGICNVAGYIIVDLAQHTTRTGVYAAGDATTLAETYHQLDYAAACGKRAGIEAYVYMREQGLLCTSVQGVLSPYYHVRTSYEAEVE